MQHQGVDTAITDTALLSYTWNERTYTESVTYVWQGVTTNVCESTFALILIVIGDVSAVDMPSVSIRAYTIPTTGLLTFEVNGVLSPEAYNILGRRVAQVKNSRQIDLHALQERTYLIRVRLLSGIAILHVVKVDLG
ncbi:MAG: hypothetical protein IJV22_10055 [Bacteroidales bacterium]|nr:hypothetical protein [Bacteroidales bacterium]MBQ9639880.1 hypothetical protein [Bacteroidales bacterium]